MTTRHSDRFSPPPRRNSPSDLSSSSFQSRGKAPPPHSWDRYSRDRSYPPRHYNTYDELDSEQFSSSNSYRQSYPPPRHHTPYSDYENSLNGQSNSYRPTHPASSQRQNRKPANLASSAPNASSPRKTMSDVPTLQKASTDSIKTIPVTGQADPTKDQEEIFKKMLEVVTEITQLKIDSTKAVMKLETTKQKYEKNTSHYAKFPIIKSTLQSEVDKAKQVVDNIQEKMARKDIVFQELAGQSLPILLPALETCELRAKIPSSEDSEVFKKLEKAIQKVELQCSELQQEFKRHVEEQTVYQSTKEKQYASLQGKIQEMISNDLGRRRENSELRSQLRALSDEFSSYKKEITTYRQEITTVKEATDLTAKDIVRVEKHAIQSEREYQENFDRIEAQIKPISSMDSNLRTLLENGLLEVKASTIDSLSSTLNATATRIDSLPGASAYSSLHSRLASLEKERTPKSLSTQVSDLISFDCDNRLKALEIKATAVENTVLPTPSVILAIQDQVQALSKHITSPPPTNSNEISTLRSLIEGLQKSLNVVQINVASLHKRIPSKVDSIDDANSSTSLNDLSRRVAELNTIIAGSNHSLDNLTARVDNISTGHLAQAILNQLSETYPHIQNFEQLALAQGEKIRGLQTNMDHLSNEISRVALKSQAQAQAAAQSQLLNPINSTDRNFGEEIDKLSENISKAYSEIKKLAVAADDDRSYISEKLELRLGSLVDCADLKNHQLELTNLLKAQIQTSLDEYNKKIVIPQLEKVEPLIERRLKDSFPETLREENASTASKLEEDLAALKIGLETQLINTLQEQKRVLEELVIAQVDRSLNSSRSELSKQVIKRVKTKNPATEENTHSTRALSRSNSPLTTPTNSVSNSAALTPSASTTTRVPSVAVEINNPPPDVVQSSTSSRNSSQQPSSKVQNSEIQRKKRKIVSARSGSPRKTNGPTSPPLKRIRRNLNGGGPDKLPCRIPKTEKD
ncbi:hypothetical protein K3495_g609 [Podosphaera aphanis]|nr:hypothetical protein K3495_g609 [Podosphaera aphanis]